jgi:hypothetical protein
LSDQAWQAMLSAMEKDQYSFRPKPSAAGGFESTNTVQGMSVTLDGAGFHVRGRTKKDRWNWGMRLVAYGRGTGKTPMVQSQPSAKENRLEYRRDALVEWYVNQARGVEQGFTLTKRPLAHESPKGLWLRLAYAGSLRPALNADEKGIDWHDEGGAPVLRYSDLYVHDSEGRELPAKMGIEGREIVLRVEDDGAVYPITVDPYVQAAKLVASDAFALDNLGSTVGISGDGATVVAGAKQGVASGTSGRSGTAYVFVRPGGGWSGTLNQTAKLVASDGAAGDLLGERQAGISSDGATVVMGSRLADVGANVDQGAGYVFTRPGGGWSGTLNQAAKLVSSDGAAGDAFGSGNISGDGLTIVEGASAAKVGANSGQGAAYIFARPGGGWSGTLNQAAKLVASDGAASNALANSTGISSNGDTVVAGAVFAKVGTNVNQGAAYVYERPGGGWSGTLNESAKLVASDGAAGDNLGNRVTINADGTAVGATAMEAKVGSNTKQGAAYLFLRPGVSLKGATGRFVSAGSWSGTLNESAKLVASDGAALDRFSNGGIGISADRSTLSVGAYLADIGSNADQGAVYIFSSAAGPASKLAFTVQPSNTAAGSSISPAVQVTVQDSSGNTVTTATNSITVAIGTNPASGTLSGTTTVSAVNGVATFSNLSIDKVGNGYTLTAAAGGLTGATSAAFNITAGAASKLAFTVQPSNTSAGSSISPAVQVTVQDSSGNTVTTATNSITVGIGTNPSGGTLSGTTTVNAVNGVATFSNLSIDKPGNGYTLTASSTGLTGATSTAFNITAGAASKLAFTVQPSNTAAGSPISPAVQVTVQDSSGNTVTTATNSITVAIGTNPSGGTLSGTTTVNAVNGVATFSNLSIDKAGNGYTLTASSSGLTGATSAAFNITALIVIPPIPIPTLSEWGLIFLMGLLGLVGILSIRRGAAGSLRH